MIILKLLTKLMNFLHCIIYILSLRNYDCIKILDQNELRNLLPKKSQFCPKKHFPINNSCLMYFLNEEDYYSSTNYCNTFSGFLVFIEDLPKWINLIAQLSSFKLFNHTFRVGLVNDNKKWYWTNDLRGKADNNFISDLKWCNENDKLKTVSTRANKLLNNSTAKLVKCGYLVYTTNNQWCLKTYSCVKSTQFICEWRLKYYSRYNFNFGSLIRYTFLSMFSISFIIFIILMFLFYEFIVYGRLYMTTYVNQLFKSSESNKFGIKKFI